MALSVAEVRAALTEADDQLRHAAVSRLDLSEDGALDVLVTAMGDDSWRVRREAVDRAAREKPAQLAERVVPLLGEPDNVGLRNAAVEVVVGIGSAAAPAVEAALRSAPEHRKVLCDVLGRIAAPSSAVPLLPFLQDEDKNVQIAAAEALGRVEPQAESQQVVATALQTRIHVVIAKPDDPSADLLASALLEAMARRKVSIVPALLGALLRQKVIGVGALRALGQGALPPSVADRAALRELILPELAHPSRARREAAILALAQVLPGREEPDMVLSMPGRAATTEALLEATVEVQRAAAGVLGATGRPEMARALLVAAADDSLVESVEQALVRVAERDLSGLLTVAGAMMPSARAAAYRVLTDVLPRVPAEQARPVFGMLVEDIGSDEADLAVAALGALGAVGFAGGAAVIAEALQRAYAEREGSDSSAERVEAARQALAALATRVPEVVLAAVRARVNESPFIPLLGRLGDEHDVATLLARLRDADVEARRAAADALAELVVRDSIVLDVTQLSSVSEAARELLVDEAPAVRAAGVHALAAIERRVRSGEPAIEGLLRAARDEDVRVRGAAARALVELAARVIGAHAMSLHAGLRALADGRDALTAVPALEALLAARMPVDDARLIDALTGPDEERRKVALHALAARPQLAVRGDLLKLTERALHDERWDLRRAAVAALGAVGDAGRPALVHRRSVETDPMVRADLDRILGRALDGPPQGPARSG